MVKLPKLVGKIGNAVAERSGKVGGKVSATARTPVGGISPNPMTNAVIADIALRGGGQILRRAVEKGLLGKAVGSGTAKNLVKGRGMGQTLLGTAIARIATRSVPGALIVGGGLLAKALYERRHARDEAKEGRKALADQAAKGREVDR
jgi:hypothetical protein